MTQKKYTDVTRLGHKSTLGVLTVGDNIVIQEKIDGANASFTIIDDELRVFSRNTELSLENTLGGFYNFVFNCDFTELNADYIYFGEWLNQHKVTYEGNMKKFFLFDIYSKSQCKYLDFEVVQSEATRLNLNLVPVFFVGKYESFEQLQEYVGKTMLNGKLGDVETGEGIVVKNVDYVDKFGNQMYVKLVTDKFIEVQKQKPAKDPSAYLSTPEYIFAESVATYPRVEKIIFKLRDENIISEDIEPKQFGLLFKECNIRTWEDILKEESDSITSDMDTEKLRKFVLNLATKHAKNYLMSIGAM